MAEAAPPNAHGLAVQPELHDHHRAIGFRDGVPHRQRRLEADAQFDALRIPCLDSPKARGASRKISSIARAAAETSDRSAAARNAAANCCSAAGSQSTVYLNRDPRQRRTRSPKLRWTEASHSAFDHAPKAVPPERRPVRGGVAEPAEVESIRSHGPTNRRSRRRRRPGEVPVRLLHRRSLVASESSPVRTCTEVYSRPFRGEKFDRRPVGIQPCDTSPRSFSGEETLGEPPRQAEWAAQDSNL